MTTPFMPVETILRIDENEIMENNQKATEPPGTSTNYISIGTQCNWKAEQPENKISSLLSTADNTTTKYNLMNSANVSFGERNEDISLVIRSWPTQCKPPVTSDQKFIVPASFSQQFTCNIQKMPIEEKFLLQFDYKTRNKLKTKQRRLDPYYRMQERLRQRTVMRIKRQDPRFRAAEREKGRCRMRLKRLDPEFRSQERERQRERMKLKRSNPDFREKEKEQQKNRLHVKKLDPTYKEKEQTRDAFCMQLKRQSETFYSPTFYDAQKVKFDSKSKARVNHWGHSQNTDACILDNPSVLKDVEASSIPEVCSSQIVFHDGINTKLLSIRPHDHNLETFYFKKKHIVNFNFYNSSKEQWPVPGEIVKNLNQIGLVESMKLEGQMTEDVAVEQNKYFPPRLKSNVMSSTLTDIKPNMSTIPETEKVKDPLILDSSIPTYSSS